MNPGSTVAHQELALKADAYTLRLGVMDYANSKIGPLEVPPNIDDKLAKGLN